MDSVTPGNAYKNLLDSVWSEPPRAGEDPPLRLPGELELQAIWFDGLFGSEFTTTDGKTARIVQFGEWNRAAGPDFLHCAVEIDGERHAGPIELDTRPSDWEAHDHAVNPAFDDVILHVVFRREGPESFARTSSHRLVPRVFVPRERTAEALDLPRRDVAVARPGRCSEPLADHSAESIRALLTAAARRRAERKAARFLRTAAVQGRDAALFQAVAETLGYRANRLPMRLLAQRVPVAALRKVPPEAVLLGAAGFLDPEMVERAPAGTRSHLAALWEDWWKLRSRFGTGPERALPWTFHGQRPANHPHRRVAALAVLAAHWAGFRRHAMARPFSPKAVIRFLGDLAHPFWNHHHTLASKPSARPLALVGRQRALELLANHLVPLALHEDPEFSWDDYLRLPSPAPNTKVKHATLRLFGARDDLAALLRPAAHHQALLEIYHDFCLEDFSACSECPFPEQLGMWH
jgi:hypothetical protein